jgi:anti-sigma-K factor RskA
MSAERWPIAPAAVALDLLEEDERAVAAQLLAGDAAFAAEVARMRAASGALEALGGDAAAWALEDAPPPVRAVAVPGGGTEPEEEGERDGAAAPHRGPRRRRALGGGAVAVAVAACVAALLVLVIRPGGGGDDVPAPRPTTIVLRPLPGVTGRAELTLNGAATEAELRGAGLRPSGPHDYYEAWLADDRGHMVSMGTFQVGRRGRVDVHMDVAVDVSRYTLVDVSLEPDDGNPAHSRTSVLRARL